MKAVRVTGFGGRDRLDVTDVETPTPGPGQVIVEVGAMGLNYSDILQRRGEYPGGPKPPYIPGVEGAGRVGERRVAFVTTGGAHAERVAVDERALIDIGDVDIATAAAFPVSFMTAWHALVTRARAVGGETVLVTAGAGALGAAVITIGVSRGLRVIAACSSDAKAARATELGASRAIDYASLDDLDERPDIVIETVGGRVYASCARLLARRGRLVLVGCASGETQRIDPVRLMMRSQSVLGLHLESVLCHRASRDLGDMLRGGRLAVRVGHTFALDDVAAAHELIESRKSIGKVVLLP